MRVIAAFRAIKGTESSFSSQITFGPASMAKYVKRSIAIGGVAVSFFLGLPATEVGTKLLTRLWTLYGAYIRMWLEQHAAFFVVLCVLCGAVVLVYGIILLPFLQQEKPACMQDCHADDVVYVPVHSLKNHFNIVCERVDFAQLLPQLYQDEILRNEEEIDKIQGESSQRLKTMRLVFMIDRKGKAGVKGFIESLERETSHLGHKDLAQELKNEYPELFPSKAEDPEGRLGELEGRVPSSDPLIDATHTKNKPWLHLDSVMDVRYTFDNDDNPCHQKLISLGLQLFPSQQLNDTLYIAACLVGNFEFPPYHELVSPVFYFWSKEPLPDSMKFDMQHSVDAKNRKQTTCLSFVAADVSTGPPFRFSLIDGGEFNPSSSSGVISTKPQGLLAIVKKKLGRLTLRTDPQIKYKAQVYYTWDTPMEYECTAHFVITPAIKAWDKVLEEYFKEAIHGDEKDVSFVKSCISLTIPDEGLFVKGWGITCTTSKMMNCETVWRATDRLVIPEIKLSIKWVGEEGNEELLPTDLHCNVNFTGSHQKKSESYFHLHSRCSQGDELRAGIW